jgi:hypothetical protein
MPIRPSLSNLADTRPWNRIRERDRNESSPPVAVHQSKVTSVSKNPRSSTGYVLVKGNWMQPPSPRCYREVREPPRDGSFDAPHKLLRCRRTNSLLKRVTGLGRLRVRGRKSVFISIYLKVAGWNVLRTAAVRSVIEKFTNPGQTASFAQCCGILNVSSAFRSAAAAA